MLIMLIAVVAGLLVTVLLTLLAELHVLLATLAGLVVMTLIYALGARYVIKKVTELMELAQKDLMASRVDKAIKVLESGLKYAPWQFFIKGQIRAQIGMIYFMRRDFNEAFEYLKEPFYRNWASSGMLAVTYMKRNKPKLMIETFDNAIRLNRKEPMLYNLYAYCLEYIGEHDRAVTTMEKGVKKVGRHELLEENLALLRDGKKMKMLDWGELWYQFHLEKPGTLIKQQTRAVQGRRKIIMR